MIRVTVWNEGLHEKVSKEVAAVYPKGIHGAIADMLGTQEDIEVRTATLRQWKNGLTDEVLENTDVLIWWGHMAHGMVSDKTVERVCKRVLRGMGFIALHSAHFSKPFKKLMGTSCSLQWREQDDHERLWVVNPAHPIAQGLPPFIEIPNVEMYGERFDIPEPQELVFLGWFSGGEVFRSGCTWQRGNGKVFYFQPGHESFPIYHMPEVQKILTNAVRWAAPLQIFPEATAPNAKVPPESVYQK